jgi:hypothetical protein
MGSVLYGPWVGAWGLARSERLLLRRRSTTFPRILSGLRLYPAYVSGAEGPERIALPGRGPQDDSAIPPGSIAA